MKKQEFETDALRRGPRHVVEVEQKEANAPVNETLAAAEKLESRGVRTQVCKVNELSPALEQALAAQEDALSGLCVVVEDTVDNGGVGEWLASHRSGRTLCISTGNRFLPHGSVNDLYRHCGLDADGIAEFVMEHRKETGLG